MDKQNNGFDLLFLWISKTGKFFKFRFIEFQKLIGAMEYFGFSSPIIKFWTINLFTYTFMYPMARILLGKEKSYKMCDYVIKIPSPPGIFSFPKLIKSKITLRESADWSILIEICITDVYHKDILKRGMNVVDIGAHIGIYTILAAEKIGDMGKIIAVEPEPKNYQRLEENVEINNFKNVVFANTALSDYNGLEKLYVSPSSVRHSLLPQAWKNTSTQVTVKTLDTLLEELHFKKIDIIKIDAEGAEISILKGAKKTLKNNPNVKIIVASYHYPSEIKEVQGFLQKMGFKTKISFSDIIVTI